MSDPRRLTVISLALLLALGLAPACGDDSPPGAAPKAVCLHVLHLLETAGTFRATATSALAGIVESPAGRTPEPPAIREAAGAARVACDAAQRFRASARSLVDRLAHDAAMGDRSFPDTLAAAVSPLALEQGFVACKEQVGGFPFTPEALQKLRDWSAEQATEEDAVVDACAAWSDLPLP